MKRFAMLALLALSPIAFAHNCPNEMKAIDAELASTKVAGANLEKVKALRTEDEKAHKDGKRTESMKALGEAKKTAASEFPCRQSAPFDALIA